MSTIRVFNAKKLALELAQGQVSTKTRAHYLLTSFLIFMALYYTGLVRANPLWTWASLIELLALSLVTLVGFVKAYDAAGGEQNPDFVVQFSCLYVPVAFTNMLLVWGAYWASFIGLRDTIYAISGSHHQFAVNLAQIGADFSNFMIFAAVVSTQALTFFRIQRLLRIARRGP